MFRAGRRCPARSFVERGRRAYGVAGDGWQVNPAQRGEPGTDGGGQGALPRRPAAEGGPEDVAGLVLHGPAMSGGLYAKPGFQRVVQVADGNACHGLALSSMIAS